MNVLMNLIQSMSDVEFACAFFAASMLWTLLVCLVFRLIEKATGASARSETTIIPGAAA